MQRKDDLDKLSLDELINQLTEDDIEKLNVELFDPDDSNLDPRDRCSYTFNKNPDGPFDRNHLLKHLEKVAQDEKDWPEQKPYTGEKKGKQWKKMDSENNKVNNDDGIDDDMWLAVKEYATEEDLVEIAAILDMPSLISQPQYHAASIFGNKSKSDHSVKSGGFSSITKHEELKLFEDDLQNNTDVDEVLEKLKSNDNSLTVVNLNNIKNISEEKLIKIAESLKHNSCLKELLMANVNLNDKVGNAFSEALKENEHLKILNVESNFLSGKCILKIIEAINDKQSITELRVCNQRAKVLGYQIEMAIANEIEHNKSIRKLNIELEFPDARIRIGNLLMKNLLKNKMDK